MDAPPALDTPRPPGQDGQATGIFETVDGSLPRAIGRHKMLVAACALVLALAGLGIGLSRPTTYTASATLQVGQVNPNSPGFLGYVQSASSLATAFSRSIAAAPVLTKIERSLDLAPAAAAARLSAEPIPLSPAFRVIATGPSATGAMRLANVTADAVIAYENRANSANPQARSLLADYRRAAIAAQRAQAEADRPSAAGDPATTARLEGRLRAARVRLRAIESAYVAAVTSQAPREGLVSLLAGATSASSDRGSKVQLYAFLGLLAGIVAGCGVALVLERRAAPFA
jgi:uncharacterized protein involved in exopolysaccharide biosynthesis